MVVVGSVGEIAEGLAVAGIGNHRGHDARILQAQLWGCAVWALLMAFWPAGSGVEIWQAVASGLGSVTVILPSALFSWWSSRQVSGNTARDASERPGASGHRQRYSERAASRVLALAGARIIGTVTLMVVAFALMQAQAAWVLVGIAAAAVGQVLAIVVVRPRR